MKRNAIWTWSALAILLGCGTADEQHEQVRIELERIGGIELEEPGSEVLVGVTGFAVLDEDRVVAVDGRGHQVRIHDRDGRLLERIGVPGGGDGPGEFRYPAGATVSGDGDLFVVESRNARISRFTSQLDLDSVFPLLDAPHGLGISVAGDELVVHVGRQHDERIDVYDFEGRLLRRFHHRNPLVMETPYWRNFGGEAVAVSSDRVVVATMIVYPMASYSRAGVFIDSIGVPPANWVQAEEPDLGAFLPNDPGAFDAYQRFRRSFTRIHHAGFYQDSLLMVFHAHPDPEELEYFEADYELDIYRPDGSKEAEMIPLAGEPLHVGRHIYVLEAEPPEPWTIGIYEVVRR